jgi:hypothetical protein
MRVYRWSALKAWEMAITKRRGEAHGIRALCAKTAGWIELAKFRDDTARCLP